MNIHVFQDYREASSFAAKMILKQVDDKPDSLLSLAAGSTPLGAYSLLAEEAQSNVHRFRQCRFVSLDEWVGLDGSDQGSCRQTMDEHFFGPARIPDEHIRFFDGKSADLVRECEEMNAYIRSYGPIDFMLLGIGMNGHLGFNEPGTDPDSLAHVTELDEVTQQVSAKYFTEPRSVKSGVTLGMKQILEAGCVVLMANGSHKADIVQAAFRGDVSERIPASLLQKHPNFHLILDEAAAAKLKP